jgi:hypothetical protein
MHPTRLGKNEPADLSLKTIAPIAHRTFIWAEMAGRNSHAPPVVVELVFEKVVVIWSCEPTKLIWTIYSFEGRSRKPRPTIALSPIQQVIPLQIVPHGDAPIMTEDVFVDAVFLQYAH